MFALGHIHYKKHILWVTAPPFTVKGYQQVASNLPYYEVLLSKKEQTLEPNPYSFYVDIISEPIIRGVMEVDARNQPIKDVTDMIQYQSYLDRKGSCQPLYKLSKKNLEMLFGILKILDE